MSPAKRRSAPGSPSRAGRLLVLLLGPGRPILIVGLLVAALVGAWYAVWPRVRAHVLSSADYLVGPDQVEITPLPRWIRSDVRAEVFRNAGLDRPLSLLDDDLTERIAHAFSLHPWIAKVHEVRKQYPARLEVDVEYRRPVCMVQAAGGLFPVDTRGVLLPSGDFSPNEAAKYPRLLGIETLPVGTLGESWGDPRVASGAAVADALSEAWEGLGLARIAPLGESPAGPSTQPTFALVTRGGTRIYWGGPPSTQAPGELPVADKIARLQDYVAKHGTLEGRGGPQELDIRTLRAPESKTSQPGTQSPTTPAPLGPGPPPAPLPGP